MQKLNVDLEYCYGIRALKAEFDFSKESVFAIYAPNGAMKSSFAQTFKDIADSEKSKDRIFPTRPCRRSITDEKGIDLPKDSVFVIRPYDQTFGHSEKTSTLLVDQKLLAEYVKLHIEIDQVKTLFLKALREQSGSKKELDKEISSTFTKSDNQFYPALMRIKDELQKQPDAPYADIRYDTIFDEKVLGFLGTKDFKTVIEAYIKKYNELLAASIYFKKGVFNYYNAAQIAKVLADNGFFTAKHSVSLNADQKLEVTNEKQLEELIAKEKEGITNDKELRKKFSEIEKLLTKNVNVREFEAYLSEHEAVLTRLGDIEAFKEDLWKSYIKARYELYTDLLQKYQDVQKRKEEIEEEARKQRTLWEEVIDIFNARFTVPFKLFAKNRESVMLRQKEIISLSFTFQDGADTAPVEKDALMQVLSTGERKALYILNIIFEIEVRKKAKQETIFVTDDIADSFDYRNKYAIIQYLKEIAEDPLFKQIILTHNFDFFRTINSRFVQYDHCLMAVKTDAGVTLNQAAGIQNVFVNDWKPNFYKNARKRIASIPFMRNIVEYTKGERDVSFVKLTSLLHWKSDTAAITQGELGAMFNEIFNENGTSDDAAKPVIDVICKEAADCLTAKDGINMENKIVLSIAIRLLTEKYMVGKINDPAFVAGIQSKQAAKLLGKFIEMFRGDARVIEILQRVVLMTPENIHVNAFMYEPILDMSDEHLRKLYRDVCSL